MFNIVEGGGRHLSVDVHQANGLERALADVNAPNARLICHGKSLPQSRLRKACSGGKNRKIETTLTVRMIGLTNESTQLTVSRRPRTCQHPQGFFGKVPPGRTGSSRLS